MLLLEKGYTVSLGGENAFLSHRSNEVIDNFIVDMTVTLRAGHLNTGDPFHGVRVENHNQLILVKRDLGEVTTYPGKGEFKQYPYTSNLKSFNLHRR